jgi:superfamily II DNA helicase RecQ
VSTISSSHGAGAGKSLCYQLAAVVGGGTVLVVSPLLALMRDQLAHLPPGLPAAMLSASQPRGEARQVLDDLRVRCLFNVFVFVVADTSVGGPQMNQLLAPGCCMFPSALLSTCAEDRSSG